MDERLALADRMKRARFQTAARLGEAVSQQRMAELVGAACKRTLGQTQWQRYEAGESEAPIDVVKATAKVSGLSEAYMFGIEISINASDLRLLTDEELDRAEKAAEATRSQRAKKKGAGRRPA